MTAKFDQKLYFDAFTKTAHYIFTISAEADFWLHLGKAMTVFFGADLAVFGELKNGEVTIHHCTSVDEGLCNRIVTQTRDTMVQVLQSGFLASEVISDPGPYSVAILPITQNGRTIAVMMVAEHTSSPMPREALNVYLSVAGLAGTTLAKLATEKRLRQSRKNLKQALSESQMLSVELARSNKELEQFAYIASHDLQEPLRMVASYVQLLKQRYQGRLDPEADDFIGFASEGASRMQNMIQDLLQYSRVGTRGKPLVPVDSWDALKQALVNLGPTIKESGAAICSGSLPLVSGDLTQLTQLFQNLIGNAIKFHGRERPRIEVSARQEGGEFVFAVKDNGIGIDPKHLEKIFVIFERLHSRKEYPGTGIGLAICKKIVERHAGRIWVESELGQGSTFFFTIPAPPG